MAKLRPLLLYVTAQPPFQSAPFAGHRIAARHLEDLRGTHRLVVLIVANHVDPADVEALRQRDGIESVVVVTVAAHQKVAALLRHMGSVPLRYSTRLTTQAVAVFRQLLAAQTFDAVWFEFSQVLPLVRWVQGPRCTVVMHDLQIQVALRGGRFDRLCAGFVAAYEKSLLEGVSEIRVLSDKDQAIVSSLYNLDSVRIAPYFHDYSALAHRRRPRLPGPPRLVFWGNLSRSENEEAAWRFIQCDFPLICEAFPNAELAIVGASPSSRLQRLQLAGVTVTGFVDDPAPYFEAADVAVAPLIAGAGIKIKVLELLSAGLPLVSTPVGAEGIDPNERLIVSPLDRFADAVTSLLSQMMVARAAP